mgnify:CR=1 FL=1
MARVQAWAFARRSVVEDVGVFVQGAADTVVQPAAVTKLVEKLRTQKHITIHHEEIPRANHFFENEIDELMASVDNYLDFRLDPDCPIK